MAAVPLYVVRPVVFANHASGGRHTAAPHLVLLGDLLVRVAKGERVRAIVSLPPRHGKTEQVSRWGPAWLLGVRPDLRIGLVSYEATFATTHSHDAREKVRSHGHLFAPLHGRAVTISEGRDSRHEWATNAGGGVFATGIGGPLTGKGFDLIIIDDPVKNAAEAASKTIRQAHWEWWQSTARTRLEPGGSVVVVMTRWHEDDLAGRLLAADVAGEGEGWEYVRIPALSEGDGDALGRAEGVALWPERYDETALAAIRRAVGSVVWQALYQGRPSAPEGGMFKRDAWRYGAPPDADPDVAYASWDMTFKDAKTSDYVVGQVWGRWGANYYLVDQVRGRWDFVRTCRELELLDEKHPYVSGHLIEDAANGPAVVSAMRERVAGLIPIRPDGSKEARAAAVSPLQESGSLYLPDPSAQPWVRQFVDEAAEFPNGVNDDQVDAMSQALRRLHQMRHDTMEALR